MTLSPRTRELLSVAMLAATGLDRQLASHARGAARLGASTADVQRVLEAVADLCTEELLGRARDVGTSPVVPSGGADATAPSSGA